MGRLGPTHLDKGAVDALETRYSHMRYHYSKLRRSRSNTLAPMDGDKVDI